MTVPDLCIALVVSLGMRFTTEQDAVYIALLNSERLRLFCVLALVFGLIAVYSIRGAIIGFTGNWVAVIGALAVLALVETGVLETVSRAARVRTRVSQSLWILSGLAEICVPGVCITLLVSPAVPVAYRVLVNPWVLVFFPLITLSTLRLRPWFPVFAGSLSAALYLLAAYYHGWRPALADPTHLSRPQTAVAFYAVILVASGFVAGAVAREIRKHVEAALAEAEVRHQLKQVQHDLEIARSIQQSLLPQTRPNIRGFEIAGWNRSADATGGDFFDWKRTSDGRLVVMLADVTGHGIGPALLAGICRAYSRASFDGADSLVVTMQRINRLLASDLTAPHFATFVAVTCNENDNTLELLSAGQGPLFTYSPRSGTFNEIKCHSIPLGLMPDLAPAPPAIVRMEPGDLLLLVTDGFIEWENGDGEQFGIERVARTVQRVSQLKPDEIINELYRCILAFANGTPQQDDLTAIVIKRVALPVARSAKEIEPGLTEAAPTLA